MFLGITGYLENPTTKPVNNTDILIVPPTKTPSKTTTKYLTYTPTDTPPYQPNDHQTEHKPKPPVQSPQTPSNHGLV